MIRNAALGQMKMWAEQMYSVIQLLLRFARVRNCGVGMDGRFLVGREAGPKTRDGCPELHLISCICDVGTPPSAELCARVRECVLGVEVLSLRVDYLSRIPTCHGTSGHGHMPLAWPADQRRPRMTAQCTCAHTLTRTRTHAHT